MIETKLYSSLYSSSSATLFSTVLYGKTMWSLFTDSSQKLIQTLPEKEYKISSITSLRDIPSPTAKQKLIEKLSTYLFYEEDWDGYGGVVPEEKTVEDAVDFIIKLPEQAVLPRPGLAGDGEVGLFWKSERLFIDVGFFGDHTYSFYVCDTQGREYEGDDISLNENLPAGLRCAIPTTVEI